MSPRSMGRMNGDTTMIPDGSEKASPDRILDSAALSPTDGEGRPIPVTIPVALDGGATVVYSTRLGGVSDGDFASCNLGGRGGDDSGHVLSNREALSRTVGAPIVLVSQVHSGLAVDVDRSLRRETSFGAELIDAEGGVIEADAMVSSGGSFALGIFAADCLPVLLTDPVEGIIAAAHCGRRGLCSGIIPATIDLMRAKGADSDRIVATLGPRICERCYEVGDDIARDFESRWPGSSSQSRFVGLGVDLAKAARCELIASGVVPDNIVDSGPRVAAATQYLENDEELERLCAHDDEGAVELETRLSSLENVLCTMENPLWYSHRRASVAGKRREGRMLAVIVRGR